MSQRTDQDHVSTTVALVISTLLVLASLAGAEDPAPTESENDRALDELMSTMIEELLLTPEQQEAIQPILSQSLKQQRQILKQAQSIDQPYEVREKLRKLDRLTDSRLCHVLSTVQLHDYRKLRDAQRKQPERSYDDQ